MKKNTRANWKTPLAIAIVGVASALAYCQWTSGCLLGRSEFNKNQALSEIQKEEKEVMSNAAQTSRSVKHATDATFANQVLQSDVPVLVDFYADWCGPCQMLAPTLEAVARETPNAKVVKVNVDHSPDLAMQYGIRSIPSIMVFKNGQITSQHVGLAGKADLLAMLQN